MCVYIEWFTHGHDVYILPTMAARPVKNRSKRTGPVGIHLNLPAELIAAYDARVTALNADGSGPQWTRTDLIRNVLGVAAKAWSDKDGEKSETP